jgi:diphosphomevalonate decarboxylase
MINNTADSQSIAIAVAHPNIAFIKYWGNQDDQLRIPANDSISMNLAGLETETSVAFNSSLKMDQVEINGRLTSPEIAHRVSVHLDLIRKMAGIKKYAIVTSRNNFPMGSGIASSASAFAALSLAAATAAGLKLTPKDLSRLARRGSGSACRSIPDGIVEWHAGTSDEDSFAVQLVVQSYWELVDCIAISSDRHKPIGSSQGHELACTSQLQGLRIEDARRRFDQCRQAIISRDFEQFSEIVEIDSNLMHSVMSTSNPSLIYWNETSLDVIQAVINLRKKGIEACYSMDAGPNVHVITIKSQSQTVVKMIQGIKGVMRIVVADVSSGARLIP